MLTHRFICALALLATLAALVQCEHITLGDHEDGESFIELTKYQKLPVFEKALAGKATYWPQNGMKITAVDLKDLNGDLNGAYAKILEGGSGEPYITIGFYSNPGFGIEYEVQVFAK